MGQTWPFFLELSKPRKPTCYKRTELNMCRGKRFPSQIWWQRSKNFRLQTVSCSGMLMMWDQLETGSMALSAPFQILAAHEEVTGKLLRAPAPSRGHWNASALLLLGPSPAAFLFLAQTMTSDISWRFKFRLQFGGSLTSERTGPWCRAELWLISTWQSPRRLGWGAEISALY